MVHDSIYKKKALNVINEIKYKKKGSDDLEIEQLQGNLKFYSEQLEVTDDTFIELRFKRLEYDLIYSLQSDPLVSQKYTPQTKASIRIVLGTLKEFNDSNIQLKGKVI